jgi:hypothetical protein
MMKYPDWGPGAVSSIDEHEKAMMALLSNKV